MWIALIFIAINATAYLVIRYTKNLYESESELKLDVKSNAAELGIKTVVEDQNANIIAGEIEIIQSRLFMSRVLDSSDFEVSYFSIGRVLNDELFMNAPAFLSYYSVDHNLYNVPIYYEETSPQEFTLHLDNNNNEVSGRFDTKVNFHGMELMLHKNPAFIKGDEIGYFFVINSREVLLDYLLRNLTAEPLNYSANTIRIAFKDNNALKSRAVLNKIDTVYLQYSNDQKNLANKQKIDWLTNELSQIERKMEDYENYFENFTLQNKTNNLDEDLRRTVNAIHSIDSQRYDVTRKITEANRLADALNTGNFLSGISVQFLPDALNKNFAALQQLQLELEKLKLSYREVTFAYRQKQKDLESLMTKTVGQLSELKIEWQKKLLELNRRKTQLENEFANLPDKNTQFSKNQRFYKLYEEFYLTLMQSKSEFEIAQAGNTPDFKILSPASLPVQPILPNKFLIAGVGLVASGVLILFFVGLLYLTHNKITGLPELEKITDVPVLGVVPVSRYLDGAGLHVIEYPKSMVSEAIRTLRTNLDFFSVNAYKKVIAISSTVSGEGKSFIAMNLGGVMALSKKKVILIDLDMRKPKTNMPVTLEDRTKGVSTILIKKNNWQECVINTSLESFDYIPSGPHPPNPSELLLNGEFSSLLEELKKQYDFIILDTPPVGLVTDGIMAMKRADISIYIFRANYSKKEFLFNLKRIISINKFSNITTLLNAMPASSKTYGYGYYEENGSSTKLKSIFKR